MPPPLPISAFQYFSFCPGGFIVATAVFRFNQRNPLFPGTPLRIGFKNLLTGGIRCQELRSQSGTKPGNLRHGKVGVCQEVWSRAWPLPLPRGEGRGGVASKSEGRNPKAERRPSSEIRSPKPEAKRDSSFGLRVSAFFRVSAFGLRISGLQNMIFPQLAGL